MGQFSVSVPDTIAKLRAQRDALSLLAAPVVTFDWTGRAGAGLQGPATIGERYGNVAAEAAAASSNGRDFIWLGIIDWAYRIQRPQHLATHLADTGNRVFYISIAFEAADSDGRFRVLQSPHPGVYEIRLRLVGDVPASIYRGFTKKQVAELNAALDEVRLVLGIQAPIVVVQYPSWYSIAMAVPGGTILYDCLDFLAGFGNVPATMLTLEQQLIQNADVIIAASKPLANHLSAQRDSTIVRNAAEVRFFASEEIARDATPKELVIGYFGAIAEWFAMEWIVSCARSHPEWRFVLIGEVAGADVSEASNLPNITFIGEQPYRELPRFLSGFDVAVIPFKLTSLVECVNPVKLYEYMSQGKPVVSCAMPEVVESTELAYIAHNEIEFEQQIVRALRENSSDLGVRRRAWAIEHTWASRTAAIEKAVEDVTPRVSVIVLSYNNLALTRACIRSVLTLSDYPDLELIVVDNASSDETPTYLKALALRDSRVRLVLNASNNGFAAGNNDGLREASGEYVIVLNNDTYVTRGWVRDIIRPLVLDPTVGLVGPLTNNIGNEQKLSLTYSTMAEMSVVAREFTSARARHRLPVQCVAFFCAAMRRSLLQEVGFLDEAYGLGFFEDDDYCKRVLAAGYSIVVADDTFIHHELSASFGKLPSESNVALMARNRAIFEGRWGAWQPHSYRDEAGFGA
jgi:GT2 family glycosyltransferase/glycosyltransferase involved in cell wall biosynthesis